MVGIVGIDRDGDIAPAMRSWPMVSGVFCALVNTPMWVAAVTPFPPLPKAVKPSAPPLSERTMTSCEL
jgi:hypothetical protein